VFLLCGSRSKETLMSKGPGKLERAIADAFARDPSATFSVEDLGPICYPGLNKVEKKHRVAIIRAADNVAARMWWGRTYCSGVPCVYCNLCDLHSYAMGNWREQWPNGYCCWSIDESEERVGRNIKENDDNDVFRGSWRRLAKINTHDRDGTADCEEYRRLEAEQDASEQRRKAFIAMVEAGAFR
jgi:hypothetical protein